MSKHTLGPWFKTDYCPTTDEICIESFYGDYVCSIDCDGSYDDKLSGQIEADAHLIATAPDLLEALVNLRRWMGPSGLDPEIDAAMRQADTAIAKAKGESK